MDPTDPDPGVPAEEEATRRADPEPSESSRLAGRRIRHYAAEFLTIFAGIVLALLADAAWDFSAERGRESEYLELLRAELQASRSEIVGDSVVRSAQLDAIEAAVDAARGDHVAADADLPVMLNALLNYRFFSPTRSVLDDLIDSGNLRILRSDDIRFALQNYLRQLDQLAVIEARERDFIADTLEPYIAAFVRVDQVLPLQSYDAELTGYGPEDTARFRAMLTDDTFASLAFMRWERSRTASEFGTGIARRIDGLIAMLDRELGVD